MSTSIKLCCAFLAFAFVAFVAPRADAADSLAKGASDYKPFAVEHIGIALSGAKELQAAVKAGDAKAAQAAWIKSRKGWEAIEPITGEFFPKLDEAINSWPDAKQGYHAVEAAVFAGKLGEVGAPVDRLVADLAEFEKQLSAPGFKFDAAGSAQRRHQTRLRDRRKQIQGRGIALRRHLDHRHVRKCRGYRGGLQARLSPPRSKARDAKLADAHHRQDRGGRGSGQRQGSQKRQSAGPEKGGRGTGGAAAELRRPSSSSRSRRSASDGHGCPRIALLRTAWRGGLRRRRAGARRRARRLAADHHQGRRAAGRHRTQRRRARSAERAFLFGTGRRQALLSAQSRRSVIFLAGYSRRRGAPGRHQLRDLPPAGQQQRQAVHSRSVEPTGHVRYQRRRVQSESRQWRVRRRAHAEPARRQISCALYP